MTIQEIKDEVYYYTGKKISDKEAEEILCFAEENPSADLSEIISDYMLSESLEDTVDQDLADNRGPKESDEKLEYEEPVDANEIRKHEAGIKEGIDNIKPINAREVVKRVYNNDFEEVQRLAEVIGITTPAELSDFIRSEALIDEEPLDTLRRYILSTFLD